MMGSKSRSMASRCSRVEVVRKFSFFMRLHQTGQAVDELEMVFDALVGIIRFQVGVGGDTSEVERLAEPAGGHAASGVFLGHAGVDPVLLVAVGEFCQQAVVFP